MDWHGKCKMPCGIAGIVGRSDKELVRKMLEVQKHRGPDSMGFFDDSGVTMGTDRLSVIDLRTGDQPHHNEDGSIWIVYNGEVYNYIELRSELGAFGHRFYSDSDTETVVHAYEQWGPACLAKLRGMFAFAIWDSNKKSLFLARDRFGKKPIYYTLQDDLFMFSSELKGLLQYEGFKKSIDLEALDYFFTYYYIPSPLSIFRGVHTLEPGSYLTFDGKGISLEKYWDMRFGEVEQTESEVIEKVGGLLTDAVRLRLRSDVPLGAYLSGGIDSGVVTSLMCRMLPRVRTVTIGFDENDDHLVAGRTVADFLKTDHREYVVEPSSVSILPRLIWHFDEPFADPSMIPTYHVARLMRENAKVAVTGDGGDEMFMGYSFFMETRLEHTYINLPHRIQKPALRFILKWPGNRYVKKLATNALEKGFGTQDAADRYISKMVVFTPATLKELYSSSRLETGKVSDTLAFLRNDITSHSSGSLSEAICHATMRGYLSDMILTKVDRMSMAVSLEPRSPLLDNVLADYVGTIPMRFKRARRTTKYIFKKMAAEKGLLPKDIIHRKKVGFGPPIDQWLSREWREISSQALETARRTKLLKEEYVSRLMTDPYVNSTKVFGLMIFTLWYSQYILNDVKRVVPLEKLV